MERDDETKKLLDGALSAGDDWLRQQGVITDFSINTIIASTYINFPQVKNVELDIDKQGRILYMRMYCSLWAILVMMLFGRRERFVDAVFLWLQEYLPHYSISVELKRYKNAPSEKFSVTTTKEEVEPDTESEEESEFQKAIKDKKNRQPT